MSDGQERSATSSQRRRRRTLRLLALGVLVIMATLYLAGYALAADRLPRGTTVAGVDVGGMRPERAERVLGERLQPRADDPLQVVVGEQDFTIDPEEVGLSLDVPASVAQVPVGRSWNPLDMWETVVGGGDYEAVVQHDDDRLAKQLEQIGEQVGEEVVEGSVDFRPEGAEPTPPQPGSRLDVEDAKERLVDAFPARDDAVELRLEEQTPEISRADVERFMDEVAGPAMSAPVTFEVAGEEIALQPEEFAPALRAVREDEALTLGAKPRRLVQAMRPALGQVTQRPREATFRIADGRPRVVPSRRGVSVDRDALTEAFLAMVETPPDDGRSREVPTTRTEPERTTEEARALGVREQVSEFTTYYPHADYRNVNIGRAAELVDGTVLEPGEVFSLNETVGERTRENGFTEGTIISDGVFEEELGGGVSQVATTTFNAMFFAGLEDVEHKPHSFYIDRYPVGREATVAWPTVDLRFRNDTDHGAFITTDHQPSSYAAQGAVTVRMWSTKVWDIESRTGERYDFTAPETRYLTDDDCVPHEGYSGFSIDVVRVFRRAGESEVDHTERFHTVYTPSDSVVCR